MTDSESEGSGVENHTLNETCAGTGLWPMATLRLPSPRTATSHNERYESLEGPAEEGGPSPCLSVNRKPSHEWNYLKFDLQRNKQHCKSTLYNQTLNVYFY